MQKAILAIESSCDDTAAAVVSGGEIISNIVSSQLFHGKYGGVIPELASRAHTEAVSQICRLALEAAEITIQDVGAIAVTIEPGLIGSLIVGSNYAKGLALRYNLPIYPINHIEGHLYSGCSSEGETNFPFIALVVSGGHTVLFLVESFVKYQIIGSTKDDAAGEAFDKIATLLGLPYPGGPQIDKIALTGNPKAYDFPRGMAGSKDYDFSFSGLKTSVRFFLKKKFPDGIPAELIPDIAASAQEAIADALVKKAVRAAIDFKANKIYIAGGVSANSRLRAKMEEAARKKKIKTIAPQMSMCVDNAAMIGFIAEKKFLQEQSRGSDLTFTVSASAIRAGRKRKIK